AGFHLALVARSIVGERDFLVGRKADHVAENAASRRGAEAAAAGNSAEAAVGVVHARGADEDELGVFGGRRRESRSGRWQDQSGCEKLFHLSPLPQFPVKLPKIPAPTNVFTSGKPKSALRLPSRSTPP